MIGRLDPRSKDVTVVGAGISGLLIAYFLEQAGYHVRLLDRAEREGGLISTGMTPLGLVERAAHSIPATPTLSRLCADLGVELCPIRSEARARWIFRGGKPRRLPLNPLELLAMLARAYFVLAPALDPESLTLEQWTRRFLGDKALRYLVTPFVRGIYGASPSEISVSAAFPSFCVPRGHSLLSYLLAKRWRRSPPAGVKRPLRRFPRGKIVAPRGGMQALTDALGRRLEEKLGSRFQRHASVETIGELETQPNLILCVPAQEAGHLLSGQSPELASMLANVGYSPLTTATVFMDSRALRRSPRGLGVLVSAGEARRCLGILYNSSAFPGRVSREDLVSVTMMLDASAPAVDSPELRRLIRSELHAMIGLEGEPLEIHARRCERAVPKYDAHLLRSWECAERSWCSKPGRILFGNYTGQLSIRGMAELAKEAVSPRTA